MAKLQGIHFEEERKNSFVDSSKKVLKEQIASKLVCSISKQTIFDKPMPTLGYLILVEEDTYNRLHVTPITELNSKESFEQYSGSDKTRPITEQSWEYRYSIFGNWYNFWMPLYINKRHYEQSRDDIQDKIAKIYNWLMWTREKPKPFEPKMVLKVLPPILVKTVIHMLKGDLHQSLATLDAYCQFYWLFMKLANYHPEIQQQIDEEVDRFLTQEEFRNKKKVGDLGEFMFKLSLSRKGIHNTEINKALLGEFLTRQATWAKKRRPELRNPEFENLIPTFIGASKVACQFFLIQFESAKLMVNDSVRAQLEEGCGCVSPVQLENFMEKINWIRNNMRSGWKVLINNIGLGHVIKYPTEIQDMIKSAFEKESQLYSKWTVIRCASENVELDDWRLPKFGYIFSQEIFPFSKYEGEFSLNPNLYSHLSKCLKDKNIFWLPMYINQEHFERVGNSFDTYINILYSEMIRFDKDKAKITEGVATSVKLFTSILARCIIFINRRRRKQDKAMYIAYIQILFTFWKLLEKDDNMKEILNQEVDLFLQDKSYRENLSWKNLVEVAIKFVLSERGGENSEGWNSLFEEIAKKSCHFKD